MRITDWTTYTPDRNFHVFLELHTEEGVSGWGAAYSQKGQVLGALEWLKRFVVGEDPLEVERVTEKLHQISYWFGRGGAMTHAISGINIIMKSPTIPRFPPQPLAMMFSTNVVFVASPLYLLVWPGAKNRAK